MDVRSRRYNLASQLRALYPTCSAKEISTLVAAIMGDKYWRVAPGVGDAIYVVALSRAKVRTPYGFKARCTHLGFIDMHRESSRHCRMGRILLAERAREDFFTVRSVVPWPVFLVLLPHSQRIYNAMKERTLPVYLRRSALRGLLHEEKGEWNSPL